MSNKYGKHGIDCWPAMEKLVNCASKLIRGNGSTPGFCSQNLEERLHAHHAAMDFTGSGGRIVSDPREAAMIAHTEARLRPPVCRFNWSSSSVNSGSSSGSSDGSGDISPPTPFQPWFKPGVTRDQASAALLPHRARDGVFVIRECSRGQGGYVLSFTTQGKVVHAQIVRMYHEGKTAFSLDGGRTKFLNLEQLVDFHKMNTGALPALLLEQHVEICPVGSLINIS